jgi:cell division protein FtsW
MFAQRNIAYVLLIIMLGLITLGLVMLTSTSAVLATVNMDGVYHNLHKQIIWLCLGGVTCVVLSRYDYQKLLSFAPWILGFACFLLMLCLVPHIGARINGSPRWIRLGSWTYQPSEFAKLALILFLSWWMGKNHRRVGEFLKGCLQPIAFTAPIFLLMIVQKDFGTTAIMLAILIALLFCAGTRFLHLAPVLVGGFAGLILISLRTPERMARWMAFLHSDHTTDPALLQKIYQQQQALIALGSGGMTGLGLGNSRQKMYWLPEVNTDFVFPIIGEELGMWVTLFVVFSFLIMLVCSGWITFHAPDPSGVCLGTGITLMIALQAMMNLAVVTSLMPCKGIPLPFISYGGSNLLTCLAGIGILFNLHRQGVYQTPAVQPLAATTYSVRM